MQTEDNIKLAEAADIAVRLISFKRSLQAIRSWEAQLNHDKLSKTERSTCSMIFWAQWLVYPLNKGRDAEIQGAVNDASRITDY